MTNLKEKYAKFIADMFEDAKANVAEATAMVEQLVNEQKDISREHEALTQQAKYAKIRFKQVAKNAKRYAKEISPNPDKVKALVEPFLTYEQAARQLPDVAQKLEDAANDVFDAKRMQAGAEDDLKRISFFCIGESCKKGGA